MAIMLAHVLCVWGFALGALARVPRIEHRGGATWDLSQPLNGMTFQRAKAISDPTIDRPTMQISRLRNLKGKVGRYSALSAVGRVTSQAAPPPADTYSNISGVSDFSTQYAIQCAWDGVPVWLLFDTGSSDTWAAQAGFACADNSGAEHEQRACGFGQPHIPDFAHGEVEDLHFFLKYGSGEEVSGPMGRSDISCGGVVVESQQVGLANNTFWHGDNVTVGILGMAYPSLTSAYYGKLGDEAPWNAINYTPFLTSAISQGVINPVFSVALTKNSSDGVIAWGGMPPVGFSRTKQAATDLIIANLINQAETAWKYSFYTIIPDGFKWGSTTDSGKYPYIVDTGTTMMYLPPPLAEAVAMAFQPRAVYLYQWGSYFAPCDAVPPLFAVIISGVEFQVNPADMMYPDLIDPLTGYCAIAVASGGAGPYILGDAFLQSVVAVFDVGGAQMRFYGRHH